MMRYLVRCLTRLSCRYGACAAAACNGARLDCRQEYPSRRCIPASLGGIALVFGRALWSIFSVGGGWPAVTSPIPPSSERTAVLPVVSDLWKTWYRRRKESQRNKNQHSGR